jgi:hypothetical protein
VLLKDRKSFFLSNLAIIYFIFSLFCLVNVHGDFGESISTISIAEESLITSYLSVIEHESNKFDISIYVKDLNLALKYYSEAKNAHSVGQYDLAITLAENSIQKSNLVLEDHDGVNSQINGFDRNLIYYTVISVGLIVVCSYFSWKYFLNYYKRIEPNSGITKLNIDQWNLIFVTSIFILIILTSVPLASSYLPNSKQSFIALGIIGEDGIADDYYPNNNMYVQIGMPIEWNIYLHNSMHETQYIVLKVKLNNSTMDAPNSTINKPSSAPVIYEIPYFIEKNETQIIPFSWEIVEVNQMVNRKDILKIEINDVSLDLNSLNMNGNNFRFIIELWVFDKDLNDFIFGWRDDGRISSSWIQIWFNI